MGSGLKGLFLSVVTESSVVIQIDMLLLAAMSIWSWSLIIYKWISLSRAKKQTAIDFDDFQDARDLSEAMRNLARRRSSIVYKVGYVAVQELKRLERAELDPRLKSTLAMDNVRRALRQGVSMELSNLSASLSTLGTTSSVAPLLGLFGTVWGIMRSFQAIGELKTASLAVVGPGIAEALVTTVVGLIVAIPAALAYNAYQGMLIRIETVLVNFAASFLNRMQRELTWHKSGLAQDADPEA